MTPASPTLRILLLKPSHYDEEGYVVQWWRALVPTQALAVINGILLDAAERQVLGAGVALEVKVVDEIATVVEPGELARWLGGAERALVMLVGVQTSQYPRAVDLGRRFVAAGIPTLMGGFHVSGIHALTPQWGDGLAAAREAGIALFAGELEEAVDGLLADAWRGTLKPLYDHLQPTVDMERAPAARIDPETMAKVFHGLAGIDLGRGCPFLCSFCTVINVHGRKPRQRPAEAAVEYVRHAAKLGIHRFLVVDDNFARNRHWEAICDALIRLREEEGLAAELFIQVDTRATAIPRFVEKVAAAGCRRVFIGIETVREDNLSAAAKKQNKGAELGEMAAAWRRAGVMIYGAFIIGFPHDTPERVAEDIRFLQENVAIDILEFFILTPLPGSVDHQRLLASGAALDPDFNRYTDEQPVSGHPLMGHDEWLQLYRDAWDWFYSDEHLERTLRRALDDGLPAKEVLASWVLYYGLPRYEGVHPLVGGLIRRRRRHQRRPGLPLEPVWRFYPQRAWRTLRAQVGFLLLSLRARRVLRKLLRER
ncbi:B12-binding domain-containing radical SAM protein [Endothiovibrio diazotrophicus]